MTVSTKVAVVAGVGPGNGIALARRFAEGGYAVVLLARDGARMTEESKGLAGSPSRSVSALRAGFPPKFGYLSADQRFGRIEAVETRVKRLQDPRYHTLEIQRNLLDAGRSMQVDAIGASAVPVLDDDCELGFAQARSSRPASPVYRAKDRIFASALTPS